MSRSVTELAQALTDLWIDLEGASIEAVQALLERRAPLLEQIEDLDKGALTASEETCLREAIELVHARDAQLLAALQRESAETTRALRDLAPARGAARAYRGAPRRRAGSVLKTA